LPLWEVQQLAWQALENLRQQQASAPAYFDVFWLSAAVTLVLVPVVMLIPDNPDT
jgi:MFS transporter, DHA2 family, multidrug resistance protein